MSRLIVAVLCGLLFGAGMVVSDMINPARVLAFLDVTGAWDPSLAFVMGGALITTFAGYRLILRQRGPMLAPAFQLPPARRIDARLIGGAAVFGIGWGIAGFCPGGALPALGTGAWQAFVFVAALIAGIQLARALQSIRGPA